MVYCVEEWWNVVEEGVFEGVGDVVLMWCCVIGVFESVLVF